MTETFAEPTLELDPPDSRPPAARRVLRAILRAPFEARTWKEFGYLIVATVLGTLVAAYLFAGYGAGLFTSITLIGIPLLAGVLLGGRIWGRIYRAVSGALLSTDLPAPPPLRPQPGFLAWLRGAFTDRTSWRALAFLIVEGALGIFLGYWVLIIVAMAVFTAISPILWVLFHPTNVDSQGREHHSLAQFGDYFIDTWPRVLAMAAAGIIACFALPWIVRGVCWIHRVLMLSLLTPTAGDRRMAELQESRRVAVEDSAATLRRLERDLHDGTQARLVSIAMMLGRAEDRLASGADPAELIADARAGSKEAITELRELVRGIHPPALELGLEPALETLTARCSIPVESRVHLPRRPSPAIEAIAYFSVAELLTNVVKHSGATAAWVSVAPVNSSAMMVSVRDNGHGGIPQAATATAAPGSEGATNDGTRTERPVGGGLSGLAARARAVDGSLALDSPIGGPTVVTLTLPIAGPQ